MKKSYYKSPIGILEIICENDALISLKLVKNAHKSSNETILIKEIRRQFMNPNKDVLEIIRDLFTK